MPDNKVLEPGDDRELRIKGVGKEMKRIIRNAALYYGVDRSGFLKMQLRLLIDALPKHIKEFKELE
jgi:hypothetical protein